MNQALSLACRGLIVLISTYVLVTLVPVIQSEWLGQDGCPKLGSLPVCYLVAACYVLVGMATLVNPHKLSIVFLIGWIPIFLLALSGSGLELIGRETCPVTATGVPLCFYSLAVTVVMAPFFWLARSKQKHRWI